MITGYGRTGEWFAAQSMGIEADTIITAKALTSGYQPLSALLVGDRIAATLVEKGGEFYHGYTYSGHPTCCAVGLKNIEIIEKEGLVKHGGDMGARLLNGLKTLEEFASVGDVRGLGLMAAVELVGDRSTKTPTDPALKIGPHVQDECVKRGLYTRIRGDIIMLCPALVIRDEEVDRIVDILREALQAVVPA